MKNNLSTEQLPKRFKHFTDSELETSGMYILSQK